MASGSNTFRGFAVKEKGGKWEPFEFDAGALSGTQVTVKVVSCGICHSDFSMMKNDWGMTKYPFVGGHEVYGVVEAVGSEVKAVKVGQRVGVGWNASFCGTCTWCRRGDDSLCDNPVGTIVHHHGGFADRIRASENSLIPIPDGYEGDEIGPLFCGGITVFSPILEYVKPEFKVGVVGIGGLGSMAVQFLRAFGCHVTAFTSTASKFETAIELGAHEAISSTDDDALKKAANSFDFIISTVNVKMNWNAIIGTLNKRGRLHVVGATLEPLDLSVFPLMLGHRTVSASPTGSVAQMITMLDFAKRHGIKPPVRVFAFDKINDAFEELEKAKQGRIVLKW